MYGCTFICRDDFLLHGRLQLLVVVWQALDVNFLLRKAATVSTPVMEVSEEDGVWTIKTSTTLKSMELKFKVIIVIDITTLPW